MTEDEAINILGHKIVVAGRAIKVYNLKMYCENNFDITPEQYLVLSMLQEGDIQNQNKLCKLLHKDKSNMARLISVLEKKGLVEKTQPENYKKQFNIITLTEKGKEIRNKIMPFMNSSRNKYLKDISKDEIQICINVLNKISANLEKKI